jgi:eukaryotic-like serine/threonine-protein kinase
MSSADHLSDLPIVKEINNPIGEYLNAIEQINCPVCGSTFSPLTRFCPNDGQALFSTQAISMQLIPNYEFTGEIGSGGMGVVYRAMHTVLRRPVAIKVLPIHQLDQSGIRRFQQEARAASLLRHENLVTVSDCGVTVTGQPYMVMDFIEGKTLERLLREEGSLSETAALPIFDQICQGIEHAHEKGILHRDLKPSNIMLIDKKTGIPGVKVLDFGIAKILHGELKLTQGLTETGQVFGSPPYMSPEQALGKDVDVRSDIYSLACVMYETLTGAPPLMGSSIMETVYKQIYENTPSLSEGSLGKKFSPDWEAFMAKALAKEPDRRFNSIADMRQQIPFPGKRVISPDANTPAAAKRPAKTAEISVVSCVILLLIGALVLISHFKHQVPERRGPALINASEANYNARSHQPIEAAPNTAVDRPIVPSTAAQSTDSVQTIEAEPHSETVSSSAPAEKSPSNERFWGGYTSDAMVEQLIKNSNGPKLDLGRSRATVITDEGIKALKSKSDIEELGLHNDLITDAGVDSFTHLHLQTLDLSATRVSDDGLKKVSDKIPSLKNLILNNLNITDAGIGYISRLPQLNRLCANKTKSLSDKALSYLGKAKTLTSLELEDNKQITTEGIVHLVILRNLTYLDLAKTGVDNRCASTLKQLTRLSGINLAGTAVDDQTIATLAPLKLNELNLSKTKISGRSTKTLGAMKSLTRLVLSGTSLRDDDLKNLTTLQNLDTLDLGGCDLITDQGMRYLSAIRSLRTLSLSGTRVTAAGLARLSKLPNLHHLDLSSTVTDDQGITSLITLPLHTLDLSRTLITRTGFVRLAQIKQLSELTVKQCGITTRDQDSFRQEEKKVKGENECCSISPIPPIELPKF